MFKCQTLKRIFHIGTSVTTPNEKVFTQNLSPQIKRSD
eukprot:UN14678